MSKVKSSHSPAATDPCLENWSRMSEASCRVDASLYQKYDVKRGLRDISGKGVLAGLTQIGEVVAYALDGDKLVPTPGKLIYRGIDIQKLVNGFWSEERYGFEETAYLLLLGALPNAEGLKEFERHLAKGRGLPKQFVHDAILKMPARDIMNTLARGVLALYVKDRNPEELATPNLLRQSLHLIAAFPALSVYAYQAFVHEFQNRSLVIHRPRPSFSTAENILHMLRHEGGFTQLEARLLDLALVLHAEHGGGNNSSFTMHVVSSSGTDTYAAVAAALSSLKGPKHGGANIKALQMFEDMMREVRDWEDDDAIRNYLMRLLNREAFDRSGLIYGVGHAVYSVSDPRSEILKHHAAALAETKGMDAEFRLLRKVETLAPEVIGEVRRMYKGVSANVDFYSGFVYRMLGIPPELYTPLFAVARIVGWCAHRIEEIANGGKIIRPAYKSVSARRKYAPLANR